ncbi:protein IQ-DOMAIN 31-like [Magnolia sinica]|uniref:protein IQ-DOMAIN 31-like n=1 Tax=Magnolia sinica TaxID=86752 RepID=UPI00265B15E3|nr:protein IQ-DOMAIN 31-like [Magnolia sinica]XP_058074872.1 protein IQ-DOMAIN 31-like [Magnolia sinica]XP_058074873.1 protein IQ-DOMAIN 31-like [Magnolia sinica]
MGKSPGKWIKTLLFGKKGSRSSASKGRQTLKATNEKDVKITGKAPLAEIVVESPLTSYPVPASTERNGEKSDLVPASSERNGGLLPENQDAENQRIVGSDISNDLENSKKEQAAIKAQAAVRGYLARRAFRALRSIIRLQAFVRGHLVRRQAVATLFCLQGIVRLQAHFRGQRIRQSDIGVEIRKIRCQEKALDAKPLESSGVLVWTEKLMGSAFVTKQLVTSSTAMPLLIQYGQGEPNSAWNWLERWTSTCFRKPILQSKKGVDSKFQTKQGTSHHVETDSGRSNRSVRRIPAANTEPGSTHFTSESEKSKHNLRKVSSYPVDSAPEYPQNELEKVKRTLRKMSNSTTEASDRLEVEAEKPKYSMTVSTSPSDTLVQDVVDSAEKLKKDTTVASLDHLDLETDSKTVATDGPVDVLHDNHPAVKLHPLEVRDGNITVTNGELSSKEDQPSIENQKTTRRRASLPVKPEFSENGLQHSPTLPSYMVATESAKAKLRGQGSPRFGQDGPEKNGFTRRHSLPSATNGKVNSPSARGQRLAQASGRGGGRSDILLLSSKDGNEKAIQAEWKR